MLNRSKLKQKWKKKNSIFGLTQWPNEIDLDGNQISHIEKHTFHGLTKLTMISLWNNLIAQIDKETFRGLTGLTIIGLSNNQLTQIDKYTFHGLTSLTVIDLRGNKLTQIDKETFNGLISLTKIYLRDNQITKIEKDTFSGLTNLTKIDLLNNKITEIDKDAFRGLVKLTAIDLENNQITQIEKVTFQGLQKLSTVYLARNRITQIDKETFKDLIGINKIYLGHNKITQIDKDTFRGLSSLTVINLLNNQIIQIDKHIFSGLSKITKINLGSNQIKHIDKEAFRGLVTLNEICLASNQIKDLDKNVFNGLRKLQIIKIHDNKLGLYLKLSLESSVKFVSCSNNYSGSNEIDLIIKKEFVSSDFIQIKEIGKGSFGVVYLVEEKETKIIKNRFALKKILCSQNNKKQIDQELEILAELENQFIMAYIGNFFEGVSLLCILTEYCQNGDLHKRIQISIQNENSKITNDLIQKWTLEMIEAIFYLHNKKVIHRDIKPGNIFLAENDSIKLGDFGVSTLIDSTIEATTYAGTFEYMSPEVRNRLDYSYNTDCWSIGCVIFETISLVRFYEQKINTDEEIQTEIQRLETSDEQKELLKKMLIMDRTKRAESFALKNLISGKYACFKL